jgi:glycerol-3-phosphate dehydrogenase
LSARSPSEDVYDVAIVGAGDVGSAIARELARFELSVALIEAGPDVGAGTSKANTAILHTGYDAKPGTLEARLVARGHDLLLSYSDEVGIPMERTGALLVAWTEEEHERFGAIRENAERCGYDRVAEVSSEELYRREPHLGPGARGALEIPDEHIVCPFTPPLAYSTQAVLAGVDLRRSEAVTGLRRQDGRWLVDTTQGGLTTMWVVNAAGLHSDDVHRMAGHEGFTVTPRRGELIVYDKLARRLIGHTILPVPTATTKGVLVAPTVFGNVMLGPTAVDIERKDDTGSTAEGLAYLRSLAGRLMPELARHEVTAIYVGLRAATEHGDYVIGVDGGDRYAWAGGIRSTGLTASMAIAEHVRDELDRAGLALRERAGELPSIRMPNIGEVGARPFEQPEAIAADPEYGRVVCFCERVTRGEIRDAARSPIPPNDLDGLRRRTRALMGRCQGFFCAAHLPAILAEETGRSPADHGAAPVSRSEVRRENCEVAIVGGGPAGLEAATYLRGAGADRVVVLDREAKPGGIPRHAKHQGFGIRDLHRVLSGPAYAARLAERASSAGAEIRAESQVTGWGDDGALAVTSPGGRYELDARAVVLATGCRERPRSARMVPGSRPQGVMTTSTLQQLVYLRGERTGRRAVVVGAEHVSFSALVTLSHGGAEAVAMVTEQPEHQTFVAFRLGAALCYRCPLLTRTAISGIRGRRRVEGVELTDLDTGESREVGCDMVVFTADWIPDHELAVLAGVELDPLTRGPAVDAGLRTSRPGTFAAGNVLHGAETADIASLSGRHVAVAVARYLGGEPWPESRVPIRCEPPLGWIAPNAISDARTEPTRGRFLLRSTEKLTRPQVELVQDGRRLWGGRLRGLGSGRSTRMPADWIPAVDPSGGPVTAQLVR